MRGGLLGLIGLTIMAAAVGDLLAHPKGTKVALDGLNGILKSSYSAALGSVPK